LKETTTLIIIVTFTFSLKYTTLLEFMRMTFGHDSNVNGTICTVLKGDTR